MTSHDKGEATQARRTIQRLEDSPERIVKEVVGACRAVAKAISAVTPERLPEFKSRLREFLLPWVDTLESDDVDEPESDQGGGTQGVAR